MYAYQAAPWSSFKDGRYNNQAHKRDQLTMNKHAQNHWGHRGLNKEHIIMGMESRCVQ